MVVSRNPTLHQPPMLAPAGSLLSIWTSLETNALVRCISTPHYRQKPGHSACAGTSANCVLLMIAWHWPWANASSLHKVSGLSARQNYLLLPLHSFCTGTDSCVPRICPQYTTYIDNFWHLRGISVPHFQSNHTVNLISPPLCLEEVGGRRRIQPTSHLLGHEEFLKVSFWKNSAHSLTCHLLCNGFKHFHLSPKERGSFLLVIPLKGNGKGWPLFLLCSVFVHQCFLARSGRWAFDVPYLTADSARALLRASAIPPTHGAELCQLMQHGLQDTEAHWLTEIK